MLPFFQVCIGVAAGLPQYGAPNAQPQTYPATGTSQSCCNNPAPAPAAQVSQNPTPSNSLQQQGPQPEVIGTSASFGSDSFAQQPQQFSASGSSSSSSSTGSGFGGGGQQGGNLQAECRKQEISPGQFKFVCDGVRQEAITLRAEHILWLTSDGAGAKVVDIEVPNYKIEELIKAGYKSAPGGDTKINVLLKRPQQSAEAEVDLGKNQDGNTQVNLQYEAPTKELVHFPNDKQYTPLRGPILPPANGANPTSAIGSGRYQRGVPYSRPIIRY